MLLSIAGCDPVVPEDDPDEDPVDEVAAVFAGAAAAADVGCSPRRIRAALSLGCAFPNPHPPSTSWATIAPAHLPVLKPQQPEAQSASLLQGPVINCVPVPTLPLFELPVEAVEPVLPVFAVL